MKYLIGYAKLIAFIGSIVAILKLAQFLIGGENVIVVVTCILLMTVTTVLAGAIGEESE